MVFWDHKLATPPRRAVPTRGGRWVAAFAARLPLGRAWLMARLKARQASLERRIARELARPRLDLAGLHRMSRRMEAARDLLAALEERTVGAPATGRRLPPDRGH